MGPPKSQGARHVPLDFRTVEVTLWQTDSQNVQDGGSFRNVELRETEFQRVCKDMRRGRALFAGGARYLSSPNNFCVDRA